MLSKLILKTVSLPLILPKGGQNFATRVRGVRVKPVNLSQASEAGQKAITLGQWVAMAAGGAGLLSLCSYAFYTDSKSGLSNMEKISLGVWPDYVKSRIHSTYFFFGSGIAVTAATATSLFKNKNFTRFMAARSPLQLILGSAILSIASGMATRALPYPENGSVSYKHLAFLLHSATIGGLLTPLCFVGPTILIRAAICTGGMIGGLSALAMVAPSDRYLTLGGPLAMGLGLVFAASVGSIFASPVSALGLGLHSFTVYGGLVVFGGFLLFDTQRVMRRAESLPRLTTFDPINASLGIYMDAINIFVRMVAILQGSGRRK